MALSATTNLGGVEEGWVEIEAGNKAVVEEALENFARNG